MDCDGHKIKCRIGYLSNWLVLYQKLKSEYWISENISLDKKCWNLCEGDIHVGRGVPIF